MKNCYWLSVVLVSCLCVMLGSGCRGLGKKKNGDELIPEVLPGDIALMERFEEGTRITDVDFPHVYFEYDSYQVRASELQKIQGVAGYMQGERGVVLIVEGHCDERGSREYNLSLGEHRADAVRAHLVSFGIDPARIQTRSFGEEKPIDPGHQAGAWRVNRRGEFALYK